MDAAQKYLFQKIVNTYTPLRSSTVFINFIYCPLHIKIKIGVSPWCNVES